MIDTVNIRLLQGEADINFLEEIPCYFDEDTFCEHTNAKGTYITGKISNLSISVSERCLRVYGGSWCKYLLGDNYQIMTRGDIRHSIIKMEDALHLSLQKAEVERLDFGCSMVVEQPPELYFSHLGELRGFDRGFVGKGSLYYRNCKKGVEFNFYDKNAEQKKKKQEIPEYYQDKNVLRYEQRYCSKKALRTLSGKRFLTVSMLYEETFFSTMCHVWQKGYEEIKKVNDMIPNLKISQLRSKDLCNFGMLYYMEMFGGAQNFKTLIQEAQIRGEIDRKEAYKLRKRVDKAVSVESGFAKESEEIKELGHKVREVVGNIG